MRLSMMLAVGVLAFSVVGCSDSSEPLSVEITQQQGHEGALPFTAGGAAADDGAVCETGTVEIQKMESIEGDPMTDADWAEMFDSAMDTEDVAEMYVYQTYTCGDGSGYFTLRWHNRFDFATFEFEGSQDVGTWQVEDGSGDYTGLAGSGEISLDWESEQAVLAGDLQTG